MTNKCLTNALVKKNDNATVAHCFVIMRFSEVHILKVDVLLPALNAQ